MKKQLITLALGAAIFSMAFPAQAQENLLADKPIHPLGGAKTWTSSNESVYTFKTEDLAKLVATPTNTSNVFLFPETGGGWDNEANRAIGIQAFYIDMEETKAIGTVTTTWEGAAANAYNIYLMDEEPTTENLPEPVYSGSKLGQYTSHIAPLESGAKGRYLVFEPTDATNWGWGVKIRSIAAAAPQDDILTTFVVTPGIVAEGKTTQISLKLLNQFGVDLNEGDVEITVSDNAEYKDGYLTVKDGSEVILNATLGETLTAKVYVADAPKAPEASAIKTPVYCNVENGYNGVAEFAIGYNGGAKDGGEMEFTDKEVAHLFLNTLCVFFSNKITTGVWNGNINPKEKGYKELCLSVFPDLDVDCTIEFEGVENLPDIKEHKYTTSLTAGQWNDIKINIENGTLLKNMSIRFAEGIDVDILLANIYFTADSQEIEKPSWEYGENFDFKDGAIVAENVLEFNNDNTYTILIKSPYNAQIWYSAVKDVVVENPEDEKDEKDDFEPTALRRVTAGEKNLTKANQNEEGYYEVNLPVYENGATGTLNIYLAHSDNNWTLASETPALSYTYSVTKTDNNVDTGVEVIGADVEGEAVYYNLQGVKVASPDKGIFIKVCGDKTTKIVL